MEFMNIVRAKVKPDHLDEYMEMNKEFPPSFVPPCVPTAFTAMTKT